MSNVRVLPGGRYATTFTEPAPSSYIFDSTFHEAAQNAAAKASRQGKSGSHSESANQTGTGATPQGPSDRQNARAPQRESGRVSQRPQNSGDDGDMQSELSSSSEADNRRVAGYPERQRQRHDGSNEEDEKNDNECGEKSAGDSKASLLDGALDLDMLTNEIEPKSEENGIFELLLPDGASIGVVVNTQSTQVGLFLSPPVGKLRDQLLQHRTQLEGHLAQRIGKGVKLTVL